MQETHCRWHAPCDKLESDVGSSAQYNARTLLQDAAHLFRSTPFKALFLGYVSQMALHLSRGLLKMCCSCNVKHPLSLVVRPLLPPLSPAVLETHQVYTDSAESRRETSVHETPVSSIIIPSLTRSAAGVM